MHWGSGLQTVVPALYAGGRRLDLGGSPQGQASWHQHPPPFVAYGGHSEDSGLKKAQVDEIGTVCGLTHIPNVQQLIRVFFNGRDLFPLDVTPLGIGHRDRRRRHDEALQPQHRDGRPPPRRLMVSLRSRRPIAAFELMATVACVVLFGPPLINGLTAPLGPRKGTLRLTSAFTDNKGNAYTAARFHSTKFPLSCIAMELATQLEARGLLMDLH